MTLPLEIKAWATLALEMDFAVYQVRTQSLV
jgi:hypothetical protein